MSDSLIINELKERIKSLEQKMAELEGDCFSKSKLEQTMNSGLKIIDVPEPKPIPIECSVPTNNKNYTETVLLIIIGLMSFFSLLFSLPLP